MAIEILSTRCFETGPTGRPAPAAGLPRVWRSEPPTLDESRAALEEAASSLAAPPRPAPRSAGLSKSAGASPSSSGGSPSPATRAPARRLSAEDAVEELLGMEWEARCGLDEPSPPRSFEYGEDALSREWAARCGL